MSARNESHVYLGGKKLLRAMNQRGLSAAMLAKKAGVSPTTISAILTRQQRVTVRTARKLSEAIWSTQPIAGLKDILADDEVA